MKKIILAGILGLSLFSVSCSSVQKADTAQNQRAEFLKLKGDWQIVSIDYDKKFKIKPFDENADAQCFVGSNCKLIPNNYSGSYTMNGGGDCPMVTQPIKFEMTGNNVFAFKKIAAGTKAKQNTAGYSLNLISQTADQFSLQQSIPFEGSTINVVYNFVRIGTK